MKKARPTSVTVFGILSIIFGGLGLLSGMVTLLWRKTGENPVFEIMEQDSFLATWTDVSQLLGFAMSVFLLLVGIALLQMRPWARKGAIGYGIVNIVVGIVGMVISITVLMPAMDRLGGGATQMGAKIGGMGGIIGGLVGLAFPALLIIFMVRPAIKNAFEQSVKEIAARFE